MIKNDRDVFGLKNLEESEKQKEPKTDLYIGRYLSLHYTGPIRAYKKYWEINVLPSFVIDPCRILIGWLCFSFQISFNPNEDDEL